MPIWRANSDAYKPNVLWYNWGQTSVDIYQSVPGIVTKMVDGGVPDTLARGAMGNGMEVPRPRIPMNPRD